MSNSRLGDLVLGQERACRILDAMLRRDRLPSLLFTGRDGVGKRTTALRLAQAANCTAQDKPCGECRNCRLVAAAAHPDVKFLFPVQAPKGDTVEARIADVSGRLMNRYSEFALGLPQPVPDERQVIPIDAVRWIRQEDARAPIDAGRRFVLILHAHRMNSESANALLKTLEEPQQRTTFVLMTDSPALLLDTIRSRCQPVRFAELGTATVTKWLQSHGNADGKAAVEAAVIGQGSLGDALRSLREPDELFAQPAADYFVGGRGAAGAEQGVPVSELRDIPPAVAVRTLVLLVREALRIRLGLPSEFLRLYPGLKERAQTLDVDYLRRALKYLEGRTGEARFNTNSVLFNYTLLAALRSRAG